MAAPFDFGEQFSSGFDTGVRTQTAQNAMEAQEEQAKAQQALEGLKMDVLNKQIKQSDDRLQFEKKTEYDRDLRERVKDVSDSFFPVDPNNKYVRQLGQGALLTHKDIFSTTGVPVKEGVYVTKQGQNQIDKMMDYDRMNQMQIDIENRLAAREKAKAALEAQPREEVKGFTSELDNIGEPSYSIQDVTRFQEPKPKGIIASVLAAALPSFKAYDENAKNEFSVRGDMFSPSFNISWPEVYGKNVTQKEPVADPKSMGAVLDKTADLFSRESSFVSDNPDYNENPTFTGTRQKMWSLMQAATATGKDIPTSPTTQRIMNTLQNQYLSLYANYKEGTRQLKMQRENELKSKSMQDQIPDALKEIDSQRTDEQFDNLFSGLPFDPNLGVKTRPINRQF